MISAFALAAIVVTTYLLRSCFAAVIPASRLSARLRLALDHVAPAVMAALLVTHLVHGRARGNLRAIDAVALAAASLVAWRTSNLAVTCGVGVATAAGLRLL